MVRPSGFHGDINGRVAEVDPVISFLIRGLDNIGPMLSQNAGESVQGTGIIRQVDPKPHQPSVFDQAALNNAGEKRDVNISATHQYGNFLSGRSEEHTSELQSPDHLVC